MACEHGPRLHPWDMERLTLSEFNALAKHEKQRRETVARQG